MKQHIELNELTELEAEKILYLVKHPLIQKGWEEFDNTEQVEYALKIYREKGLVHNTLHDLSESCTVGALIGILEEKFRINIKSMPLSKNVNWMVDIINEDFQGDGLTSNELCDALWILTKKII